MSSIFFRKSKPIVLEETTRDEYAFGYDVCIPKQGRMMWKKRPRRGINHNVKHLYQQNKLWNSTYARSYVGRRDTCDSAAAAVFLSMGCHAPTRTTSFNAFLIYYTSPSISFLPYSQALLVTIIFSARPAPHRTQPQPIPATRLGFSCEWNIV